jgi:LmbE family N-acetylglucosaminyl deacetylase
LSASSWLTVSITTEDMAHASTRLLLVVAHPDDESFGCGSLLAHAAMSSVQTTVCCATRGEAGDDRQGLARGSTLGEVRMRELRAAANVLGVGEVRVLGWADSDMAGEPALGSLAAASPAEIARAVTKIIEDCRPDIVVTLDGSDGHRDHAIIRDATIAACELSTWPVKRVYLSCLPRSLMVGWAAYLTQANPGSNYLALGMLGTPDEEITTVVDTSAVYDLRWQAIRAHASQTSPFEILPPQMQRDFLATDRLRRIRPRWTGPDIETRLF